MIRLILMLCCLCCAPYLAVAQSAPSVWELVETPASPSGGGRLGLVELEGSLGLRHQ